MDAQLGQPEMRGSLMLVVYLCMALFWAVVCLVLFIAALKTYYQLRRAYRDRRKKHFQVGVEDLLMEEPVEKIQADFRPTRPFDMDIVLETLMDSMKVITGPPFETLKVVAHRLGFIEANLKGLSSRSNHTRARAMQVLGAMRASQAIVPILDRLSSEPLDTRLVALRSLAAIGDKRALPYFIGVSESLPPPLLPRLASLMLEFGPAGHPFVGKLVAKHRDMFPPLMLEELLKELAMDLRRPV